MDIQDIERYMKEYRASARRPKEAAAPNPPAFGTYIKDFLKKLPAYKKPLVAGAVTGTATSLGYKAYAARREKKNAEAAERAERNTALRTSGLLAGVGAPVAAYFLYQAIMKKDPSTKNQNTRRMSDD